MEIDAFESVIAETLAAVPEEFRGQLGSVAIVVDDWPTPEQLRSVGAAGLLGLYQGVPRTAFQGIADIKPGMQFQAEGPQGARVVRVVKVEPETITIDANHPLAGMTLSFDVTVTAVRAASDEELTHGHVHGEGGHQH